MRTIRHTEGDRTWFLMTELEPITVPSLGDQDRRLVRARFQLHGTEIQVFGIHLESFPLVGKDRAWFASSPLRLQQAKALADTLKQVNDPVIVAGDFNAPPSFRSIRALRGILTDAWEEAGWGLGNTYYARDFWFPLPLARIDAILYRGLVADRAQVVPNSESDHLGVRAVLNLETPPPGVAE